MPPKKRKADEAAPDSPSSTREKKAPKMSKEEKKAARERAREAMTVTTTSTTTKAAKKTSSSSDAKAKSPTRKPATAASSSTSSSSSPSRTKKPANKKSSTKTTTTTTTTTTTKTKDNEVPLPPSFKRTESTPLELELQSQVMANVNADMESKPLPFTTAPPEHLLQFAPQEAEEGYEQFVEDEEDDNNGDGEQATTTIATTTTTTQPPSVVLLFLRGVMIGFVVTAMAYMCVDFWHHDDSVHSWTHHVKVRLRHPLAKTCFRTNIKDAPLPDNPNCRFWNDCPSFGNCYGGVLQTCQPVPVKSRRTTTTTLLGSSSNSNSNSLVMKQGQKCVASPTLQETYWHVVDVLQEWTMNHFCQNITTTSGSSSVSPEPNMFFGTSSTGKHPLFELRDVLEDAIPLELVPREYQPTQDSSSGNSGSTAAGTEELAKPLNSMLELGNTLFQRKLKLQTLQRYDGGGTNDEEAGRLVQVHLGAVLPEGWPLWRRTVPVPYQCHVDDVVTKMQTMHAKAMDMPWFMGLFVVATILVTVWLWTIRYYLYKYREQQEYLELVELVRAAVLKKLATETKKSFPVSEMQTMLETEFTDSGPMVFFRETIWPRVVFDIRGDSKVETTTKVTEGEAEDYWTWKEEK